MARPGKKLLCIVYICTRRWCKHFQPGAQARQDPHAQDLTHPNYASPLVAEGPRVCGHGYLPGAFVLCGCGCWCWCGCAYLCLGGGRLQHDRLSYVASVCFYCTLGHECYACKMTVTKMALTQKSRVAMQI